MILTVAALCQHQQFAVFQQNRFKQTYLRTHSENVILEQPCLSSIAACMSATPADAKP